MFCLRSWLPLLFIPTHASPIFVLTFFLLTYYLNRPCVYCSMLLVILFASSCYWSDACWFDVGTTNLKADNLGMGCGNGTLAVSHGCGQNTNYYNWFEPRYISSTLPNPLSAAAAPYMGSWNGTSRASSSPGENGSAAELSFLARLINSTLWSISGAAAEGLQSLQGVSNAQVGTLGVQGIHNSQALKAGPGPAVGSGIGTGGIGLGWARNLLGGAEWRVPLLGVDVRL